MERHGKHSLSQSFIPNSYQTRPDWRDEFAHLKIHVVVALFYSQFPFAHISSERKRNQFIDCWIGGSRARRSSLVWVVYFVWSLSICWCIVCTVFVYVYSKSFVCVSAHSIDTRWTTTRLSYKIIKQWQSKLHEHPPPMTNRSRNNFSIHQPLWSLNERAATGQHILNSNDIIAKIKMENKNYHKILLLCWFGMRLPVH